MAIMIIKGEEAVLGVNVGASHCNQWDFLHEGRHCGSSQITLGFLVSGVVAHWQLITCLCDKSPVHRSLAVGVQFYGVTDGTDVLRCLIVVR